MHSTPLTGNRSRLYGFLIIALATTLYSSKAIFIKLAYQAGAIPDIVLSLRMIFSLPFFILIALQAQRKFNKPIPLKTLGLTAATGIMGYYIASAFDLYGLQYISASLERLVLYSYPTLVIIMSSIFLGAAINRYLLLCIAIIYGGLLTVFLQDASLIHNTETITTFIGKIPSLYYGGLLVFISAFAYASYLICSEFLLRSLPSKLFTAYAMLAASFIIIIHFSLKQPFAFLFDQSLTIYSLSLILAFFCTVLPAFMLSAGIQIVGASTAGMIGSLGPIATIILGALLLNEQITSLQLIGFTIVIGGVILMSKFKRTSPSS